MNVWKVKSIDMEPEVRLSQWRVIELLSGERHFLGYNETTGGGRVSSAVIEFDVTTKRGTTRSGRIYELVGPPGFNDNARYTWNCWKQINGVDCERDVTNEV